MSTIYFFIQLITVSRDYVLVMHLSTVLSAARTYCRLFATEPGTKYRFVTISYESFDSSAKNTTEI